MSAPLVDVHAHFLTPWYVDAAEAAGHRFPDGMPAYPSWTPDDHLRLMDEHGIGRSVLSISSPGVSFGDVAASVQLCRRVNDHAAELVARRPDRFGFFASVPLPAVDEALEEAGRALDDLGAAGVVITTNAGGRYLGDPALDPFLAELGRRGAVVFVHPTSPVGWECAALGFPQPMVEFFAETTRSVSALLIRGFLADHPGLRMIVPHCGASLPVLIDRLRLFASLLPAVSAEPATVDEGLERLWFDLAGTPMPVHADTLVDQVGTSRLLYGSDFCWTPPHLVAAQLDSLDKGWRAAEHGPWRELVAANAARLWGRA
jgi:predicted TIM-barrel fold metal-dependent hydrolase